MKSRTPTRARASENIETSPFAASPRPSLDERAIEAEVKSRLLAMIGSHETAFWDVFRKAMREIAFTAAFEIGSRRALDPLMKRIEKLEKSITATSSELNGFRDCRRRSSSAEARITTISRVTKVVTSRSRAESTERLKEELESRVQVVEEELEKAKDLEKRIAFSATFQSLKLLRLEDQSARMAEEQKTEARALAKPLTKPSQFGNNVICAQVSEQSQQMMVCRSAELIDKLRTSRSLSSEASELIILIDSQDFLYSPSGSPLLDSPTGDHFRLLAHEKDFYLQQGKIF